VKEQGTGIGRLKKKEQSRENRENKLR